jgi:hypothetical protein
VSADAHVETVKAFLGRAKTAVSEGDVAAGTGLDVGNAKSVLYDLMRTHRAALAVHDDGTLVYDFGAELVPLDKPSWGERFATVGRGLWKGFSWLYKASLAIVLVAYAVAFVVLIIAAAIAASAAAEDEGPVEGVMHLVGGVFRAIFEFITYAPFVYSDVDRYGYPHAHFEPKAPVLPRSKPKEHEKSFIASVYDFVLGPTRVAPPPLAQEQEVAAFVRDNGGVLTVRDVQALSGMTRKESEQFFARFVAEQDGVAEITEEGALYATFEELLRSQSRQHDAPVVFYWDEYEAPLELTGNTTGKNVGIALLAAFNLLGSYFVMSGGANLGEFSLWLGVVPAILFTLFFAIPLLRAPLVWWKNRQQHAHNIRKRLYRVIFGTKDDELAGSELIARANRRATTEEKLRIADIRELVDDTLLDVGGHQGVDERGEATMNLSQIQIEAQAVEEHALAERQARVVYRTD